MGDIAIKLTLSFHQRQMLRFIAERGGRISFQFGATKIEAPNLTDEQRAEMVRASDQSVRELATLLHVVDMVAIIGRHDTYELALNNTGRQVIEQMGLVVKPQNFNIDTRTGKEIKGT